MKILLDKDSEGGGGKALSMEEFQGKVLTGVGAVGDRVKAIEGKHGEFGEEVKGLKKTINELSTELSDLKKQRLFSGQRRNLVPAKAGCVSDDCAMALASQYLLWLERNGKFEKLPIEKASRESMLDIARGVFDINVKTALSTTEIPLPVEYTGELRELISQFGVARKQMMHYPIGMGTSRPPRMGTRPAFASIAMSGAFSELSPTVTFASLESHKIGGLVRVPRELDEQSIVPMGQFLARFGAIEFARVEDKWAFLADGTGTYESVKGIMQIAIDNSKTVQLVTTKTHSGDAVLADFRTLRTKVNKAALSGRVSAYYLDTTWESQLRTFNTQSDPYIYVRNPDGSATFDGYPVIWTDVLLPFSTSAVTVSQTIAVFGALQYWWMGEHGSPRIDQSSDVFFVNDQLAVRFIEEIDFDYQAVDATAALLTAAS
jgi:HK97 family phage major capsid protein